MVKIDEIVRPKSTKAEKSKYLLQQFVIKIDKELSKYFESEIENGFGKSLIQKKLSQTIWKHIKEHNLRPAKRIRGSFVHYGYLLLGGNDQESIIQASMAVELIHTALLIHGDIMDQDDTRRGLPTTHEYFKSIHNYKKYRFDPKHFGESMAINLGDIAIFSGNKLLTNSPSSPELKVKALAKAQEAYIATGLGQSYDVILEASGIASKEDIVNLHYAKTGIYTYENPLHIGAILAGAKEDDLKVLSSYAIPGGIAFQLQDDILGLFGDSEKTGKSDHSDLKQGKMTLLIVKAIEFGSQKQVKRLKQIWGKRDITEEEANEARKIIIDTGSLEYSKKLSINYAQKAQKTITQMHQRGWDKKAVEYLDGIVQYMIERDM